MKLLTLVLLILIGSAIWAPTFFLNQPAMASISSTDPDFSIVLFPDTQYYNSTNAYVFRDQANWVVAHRAALNAARLVRTAGSERNDVRREFRLRFLPLVQQFKRQLELIE